MDRTRSHRVPQVHIRLGRMVFRHCRVGGHVVRRTSVLELEQPRRHQVHRKGLPVTGAHGLPGNHLPVDVGLLAKREDAQTGVLVHRENPRQAH